MRVSGDICVCVCLCVAYVCGAGGYGFVWAIVMVFGYLGICVMRRVRVSIYVSVGADVCCVRLCG